MTPNRTNSANLDRIARLPNAEAMLSRPTEYPVQTGSTLIVSRLSLHPAEPGPRSHIQS